MTIGLITPYFPDKKTINSGLANHFDTLANALAVRGNRIIVIHARPAYGDEPDMEVKHKGAIIVITLSIALSPAASKLLRNRWAVADVVLKIKTMQVVARALPQLIKEYGIAIIETTSFLSLTYFCRLSIPLALRVSTTYMQMLTQHYTFQSRALRLFAKLEIRLIRRSRYLLTHTHNHAREIETLYGIPANRFKIIPHGIVIPGLPHTNIPNAPITVLFVGRMEYRKGIDILLKAIPMVLEKQPEIVFQLIGEDNKQHLENEFRLAHSEAVNKQVSFLGVASTEQTQLAYANCDLFVAPSRYESFGLIYVEAMSFGKPVIGCHAGGAPEVIEDGKTGLLAAPGDAESLTKCIIQLTENTQLRQQMGQKAKQSVLKNFTAEVLAERSEAWYKSLINN